MALNPQPLADKVTAALHAALVGLVAFATASSPRRGAPPLQAPDVSPRGHRPCCLAALLLVVLAGCDAAGPEPTPERPLDYAGLEWESLHGPPGGGRFEGLLRLPDGALLAVSAHSGVHRLRSTGGAWERANEGLPTEPATGGAYTSVAAAAVDGRGRAYVLTRDRGVYRSADGGDTWQAAHEGITEPPMAVALAAGPGDLLLASTYFGGLYRSLDGGATWSRTGEAITGEFNTNRAERLAIGPDGTAYAASHGRVFRSADDGATWQPLGRTFSSPVLAVDPSGALYVGTPTDGLFRSADRGDTWARVATARGVRDIAVEPAGEVWLASDEAVLVSRNGGGSWEAVSGTGLHPASVSRVWPGGNGHLYAGTEFDGLYRLASGTGVWAQVGLASSAVFSISESAGAVLYAATLNGLYRSSSGGAWTRVAVGDTRFVYADPDGAALFAYRERQLSRSTDGGASWAPLDPAVAPSFVAPTFMGRAPSGALYLAVPTNGGSLFRSGDLGQTWAPAGQGLTGRVSHIEFRPGGGALAATSAGVFTSPDAETWSPLSDRYRGQTLVTLRDGALLAAGGGFAYRSDDGGATWRTVLEVEGASFEKLAVDGRGGVFLAASLVWFQDPSRLPNGVYVSGDGGVTWGLSVGGMGQLSVLSMVTGADGRVYAGTDVHGVFRSRL